MNSSAPTPPSNPVPYPQTPDFASLYNQGIQSMLGSAPQVQQTAFNAETGQGAFAGTGAADLTKYTDQVNAESADRNAAANLALQQKYGSDYNQVELDSLKQLDPEGYLAHQKLGQTINSDLDLGTTLDPTSINQLEQQARGISAAHGNVSGLAPAIEEGMTVGNAGLALQQQRLGNAQAFTNGQQLTTPATTAPTPFQGQVVNPTSPVNPAAGTAAISAGQSTYGTQGGLYSAGQNATNQLYNSQLNYTPPWMALAGTILGGGLGYAGKKLA
ncbi:MAG TPA: hypothetical protein VGN17_05210 [Bryobacteraceae bacterium]|jgi:hypothetical protein